MKKTATATAAFSLALSAIALPTVQIDSVVQRWPWNNKVDITYTVDEGQNSAGGVYAALRFVLTANGVDYPIEGYAVGASAEDGEHTVTWNAPRGIKSSDCTLTATLFATNVPSGNDYMIIDLASGAIHYEGVFVTQADSDSRYNVDDFKENKMVLRKVPKWADKDSLRNAADLPAAGYPAGSTNWQPTRDYYIGVFPVTQGQYVKLGLSNPSGCKTSKTGNTAISYRPVENVTWNDLRVEGTAPTSSVPVVAAANTGTFLQRLNFLTGNKFSFDLPTEVMFEIAQRAGATTTYAWGSALDTSKLVCKENANGQTWYVGSKDANYWGLYDMTGNVYEWVLDDASLSNLNNAAGPFKPACTGNGNRRRRGGISWAWNATGNSESTVSYRNKYNAPTWKSNENGFRVALVAE